MCFCLVTKKKNIWEIMKIDKAISVEISSLATCMYALWMSLRKQIMKSLNVVIFYVNLIRVCSLMMSKKERPSTHSLHHTQTIPNRLTCRNTSLSLLKWNWNDFVSDENFSIKVEEFFYRKLLFWCLNGFDYYVGVNNKKKYFFDNKYCEFSSIEI